MKHLKSVLKSIFSQTTAPNFIELSLGLYKKDYAPDSHY